MEDLWGSIKGDLLSAADKICGQTKGLLRHQVTWWWKKDADKAIKWKRQLWKEWKKAKKDSKRAELERFSNIINRDDIRKEVFKIAKQMKAENCSVAGGKCVRDDKEELTLTDAERHLAWKKHYQRPEKSGLRRSSNWTSTANIQRMWNLT